MPQVSILCLYLLPSRKCHFQDRMGGPWKADCKLHLRAQLQAWQEHSREGKEMADWGAFTI